MTLPEFDPCPFCLSEDIYIYQDELDLFFATCRKCGAEGPPSAEDKEDATDAWNHRAVAKPDKP